jgi:XTP/dITP diphosphohydrolase
MAHGRRLLVVASHNEHKIRGDSSNSQPIWILQVVGIGGNGRLSPGEEDGETFPGQCPEKGAGDGHDWEGAGFWPMIQGLEVDALDGAPGVHSARFAGERAGEMRCNNRLLLSRLGICPWRSGEHSSAVSWL